MPTHKTTCLFCAKNIYCTSDDMISVGGKNGAGGCYEEPHLDFCNTVCAEAFRVRIADEITRHNAWTLARLSGEVL